MPTPKFIGSHSQQTIADGQLTVTVPPLEFGRGLERFANRPAYVVWHHAGTQGDASAQDIHRWHSQRRAGDGSRWSGIGYHYVVRMDGTIEQGRPEHCAGAHAIGLNNKSLGICFSGNCDDSALTARQLDAGLALTRLLLSSYGLRSDHVLGHREVNELVNRGVLSSAARTKKTCPGRKVDMTEVRAQLRGGAIFKTGVDVLRDSGWSRIAGKRVGLVTNQTGKDSIGCLTSDLMMSAAQVNLCALFCPEHGLAGVQQGAVPDALNGRVPVFSLHTAESKRPTAMQLALIDVLVYDVQDAGTRFFSHTSTLRNVLETASAHSKPVIILDRPNPLGGSTMEGPLLPKSRIGFNVGAHTMSIRYALTAGELALLLNAELRLGVSLEVVPLQGWDARHCGMPLDCAWAPLSPNLTTQPASQLYPGLGLLEPYLRGTGLDLGRQTVHAYQRLGASWLDAEKVISALDQSALTGSKISSLPFRLKEAAVENVGIAIEVRTPSELRPVELGLALAIAVWKSHPTNWPLEKLAIQLASPHAIQMIQRGASANQIASSWAAEIKAFAARSAPFLLYPR